MIPKTAPDFRKRSCSNKNLERHDNSKKSHPALGACASGENTITGGRKVAGDADRQIGAAQLGWADDYHALDPHQTEDGPHLAASASASLNLRDAGLGDDVMPF